MIQIITSWVTLGALVGALVAGTLADKIGRRLTILLAAILFVLGALLESLAPGTTILVIGRLVVGFGVGVASVADVASITMSIVSNNAMSASKLPGGGINTLTGKESNNWLVVDLVTCGGSMITESGRALRESETTTTPAVSSVETSRRRASFVRPITRPALGCNPRV